MVGSAALKQKQGRSANRKHTYLFWPYESRTLFFMIRPPSSHKLKKKNVKVGPPLTILSGSAHVFRPLVSAEKCLKFLTKRNAGGYDFDRSKIVSEYDQEIPQSQTADNPLAPRGRAAQPSQDTRKTN